MTGDPGLPVAVVAPMAEELASLVRATAVDARFRLPGVDAVRGRLDGVPVVLAVVGDGAARTAAATAALLDAVPVRAALLVGIAGGLAAGLAPGRVVVARTILDGETPAPAPDGSWSARIARASGAAQGTLLASPEILGTADAKCAARRGIAAEATAADLESAAFAWASAGRSVPFAVVRAISDTADESLPVDFNRCRRADGGVSRLRVALRALRRPSSWPALWHLRARVRLCAANLSAAVRASLRPETA